MAWSTSFKLRCSVIENSNQAKSEAESEIFIVVPTSVWQPLSEIGRIGVRLLTDLVEGREVAPGLRRLPVRLDIRESCGAAVGRTTQQEVSGDPNAG
jgi:hypothetical protein